MTLEYAIMGLVMLLTTVAVVKSLLTPDFLLLRDTRRVGRMPTPFASTISAVVKIMSFFNIPLLSMTFILLKAFTYDVERQKKKWRQSFGKCFIIISVQFARNFRPVQNIQKSFLFTSVIRTVRFKFTNVEMLEKLESLHIANKRWIKRLYMSEQK